MEMVGVLFIVLLLIFFGSQVLSDAARHRYSVGDNVTIYANTIGPFSNSWEKYAYYDLTFCSPDNVEEKKLNLGEMLNGHRLVSAPYKLEFRIIKDFEVLCKKRLNKTDVSHFRNAIEKDYYMQMYYDDLPVWAFIGFAKGDENGNKKYFLYKHFTFEVFYNNDFVISVSVRVDTTSTVEVTEDKEVDMEFTYNVNWLETQQPFEKRMEKYIGSSILPHHMDIHRSSITNSCVTILLLIICLVIFYVRVLRKDISKCEEDVEKVEGANKQEEIGWKKIHGDVFRFPKHKSLFAAALGSGTQLLVLMAAIIVLGVIGVFQPYAQGVFTNALVIVYAITSIVSGYFSASFYRQLEGTNWMKNMLVTGGLYTGPLFLTFCFLNTIAVIYKTTAALPFRGIVILSLLWTFLASPLLLFGGIFGKNMNSEFQAPCRTAECPREVPRVRWYRSVLPQMALAGFLPFSVINVELYYIFATVWGHRVYALYNVLAVVLVLLVIITALVSVAFTYFQLAVEDHRWWWRSFLYGGATGLYIYGYCIYFYLSRSDMNGFLQTSFFFGYMACTCFGIFLLLGTVGFYASLLFVRYLYTSIKCE